mmetsp:Transcript_3655/g.7110  ORF Transcript_3655/g.7110 Transcript_3655/m.7110 type:complete len:387 (+) Transcript_3655:229-1389(+)
MPCLVKVLLMRCVVEMDWSPVTAPVTRKVMGEITMVWHTPPIAPAERPATVGFIPLASNAVLADSLAYMSTAPLEPDSIILGPVPFQNALIPFPCLYTFLNASTVFSLRKRPIRVFHTSNGMPSVAASAHWIIPPIARFTAPALLPTPDHATTGAMPATPLPLLSPRAILSTQALRPPRRPASLAPSLPPCCSPHVCCAVYLSRSLSLSLPCSLSPADPRQTDAASALGDATRRRRWRTTWRLRPWRSRQQPAAASSSRSHTARRRRRAARRRRRRPGKQREKGHGADAPRLDRTLETGTGHCADRQQHVCTPDHSLARSHARQPRQGEAAVTDAGPAGSCSPRIGWGSGLLGCRGEERDSIAGIGRPTPGRNAARGTQGLAIVRR